MIRMGWFRAGWFWAALAILPAAAFAQGGNYPVRTMNFDLWCQEEQHLDPDRCDKHLPADEQTFEAYRDKIEQYEIPYLQEKQNEISLDRNILHKDPVDNPITQQTQSGNAQDQRQQTIDPRTPHD